MKYILAGIIAAVVLFGGVWVGVSLSKPQSYGSTSTLNSQACTPNVAIAHIVGNQQALTVLPANGRRAYATIQVAPHASSTVYLSIASTTATVGNGVALNGTSSTTESVSFGLATDFTYTGAVSAITNTGSTTVLVTQCNF